MSQGWFHWNHFSLICCRTIVPPAWKSWRIWNNNLLKSLCMERFHQKNKWFTFERNYLQRNSKLLFQITFSLKIELKANCEWSNGQTNSKWFFQANISSKKRTNKFDFTTCQLVSFVLWKNVTTPKRHFEINWLLVYSIGLGLIEPRSY